MHKRCLVLSASAALKNSRTTESCLVLVEVWWLLASVTRTLMVWGWWGMVGQVVVTLSAQDVGGAGQRGQAGR
ncbi:MAG: hypothetical protein H6650_12000 [Ardenticatenales bacterium]|nr:hypothetical protein [Ardenticatenales bacterium]